MSSDLVLKSKEYIKDFLKDMENKWFFYHNLWHTLEVFDRATYLLEQENIDNYSKILTQIAALFHDSWLKIKQENHEYIGAELAEKFLVSDQIFLEEFPQNDKAIQIIKNIIIATIPSKKPLNKLEGIIKDSDIDNLWRDDFIENTYKIKNETEYFQQEKISEKQRFKNVYKFIKSVEFYTPTQKKERDLKLKENIKKVFEMKNQGE